jgi:ankyrin repeat protein
VGDDVPIDALGDDGTTALIEAARKQPKVVQFLIEKGANINATNLGGDRLKHYLFFVFALFSFSLKFPLFVFFV